MRQTQLPATPCIHNYMIRNLVTKSLCQQSHIKTHTFQICSDLISERTSSQMPLLGYQRQRAPSVLRNPHNIPDQSLDIDLGLFVRAVVFVRSTPLQGNNGQPSQRFHRIARKPRRDLEHQHYWKAPYQVVLDVERRRKVGRVSRHQRSGIQRVSHDGQGIYHQQGRDATRRRLFCLWILLPRFFSGADVHRSWPCVGRVQSRRVQQENRVWKMGLEDCWLHLLGFQSSWEPWLCTLDCSVNREHGNFVYLMWQYCVVSMRLCIRDENKRFYTEVL